jgi:hypothetical protein
MRFVVATALFACACGPGSASDLPRPSVLAICDDDLCSRNVALDANGELWRESGCEASSTGWDRVGEVDETVRAEILAEARTLIESAAADPCVDPDPLVPGSRTMSVVIYEAEDRASSVGSCTAERDVGLRALVDRIYTVAGEPVCVTAP